MLTIFVNIISKFTLFFVFLGLQPYRQQVKSKLEETIQAIEESKQPKATNNVCKSVFQFFSGCRNTLIEVPVNVNVEVTISRADLTQC